MTAQADRQKQQKQIQQLKLIQAQIASYTEKCQVQNKRIKFLKKQSEELRAKEQENSVTSEEILEQNTTLKKKNRQLKSKLAQIKKLLQSLQNPHSLTSPSSSTISIKDIIITHKTQQLDLPKLQINDEQICQLKNFTNIRTLILSENLITDTGARFICENLRGLRKLFINNNKITYEGVKGIEALTNLRCLDLRVNDIGDQGMKQIVKLKQLTQLSVSNNKITDQSLHEIANLQNLRYLDLTSNQISNKGALALLALKNLTNLYLSHNKIQTVVAVKLLQLPELRVLDLRFNQGINKEQKEEIKGRVKGLGGKEGVLQLFV